MLTILALVRELASYENALHEVHATTETLLATLSFPSASSPTGWTNGYAKTFLIIPSPAHSSIMTEAEIESRAEEPAVAGMALYFHNYSTWTSATVRILHGGEELFRELGEDVTEDEEEEDRSTRYGTLFLDKPGACRERWTLWKARFLELRKQVDEDVGKQAVLAAEKLEKIEWQASLSI